MPFAAESAGRVALGKLRAMSPSVPTCAYTVRTPEYIVTARFYYGRPIVDITPIAGTSLTEEYSEDSVFVDSGLLFYTAESPFFRAISRQTQQVLAEEAVHSWLGTVELYANGGYKFKSDNKNPSTAIEDLIATLPYIEFPGRARRLKQALLGRMDSRGVYQLSLAAAIPDFGLCFTGKYYYCLSVHNNALYVARLLFSYQVADVDAISVEAADKEKKEAYILSLADLRDLQWEKLADVNVIGSPLAYGWNWSPDGLAGTSICHTLESNGITAVYTARRYHIYMIVADNGELASATTQLLESSVWYPRRQFTNIWFPVGLKVACLVPPLTSSSYQDSIPYDAPIYSFFTETGALRVVRLSHSYNRHAGKNEIINDPYVCGFETTGWRVNHDQFDDHTYTFTLTDTGEYVRANGYGYSAVKMRATLNYVGSTNISTTIAMLFIANACPSGSGADISASNNTSGVDIDYGQFTVEYIADAVDSLSPRVALIISPYDCESVTLLSSENYSESGTIDTRLQVNSVATVCHFTEHDLPVYNYMTTNSSPYIQTGYEFISTSSFTFSSLQVGLQFSTQQNGLPAAKQATVFLDPTLEEMLDLQVPPLVRQGSGVCWFVQHPDDYSNYSSSGMVDEADVKSTFTGWA
ncbi:MAG: hypothetical protein JSR83_01725 [Proteobacteria bacterium]|nr:hypothetical protein [Pseudomonadota bacterium]